MQEGCPGGHQESQHIQHDDDDDDENDDDGAEGFPSRAERFPVPGGEIFHLVNNGAERLSPGFKYILLYNYRVGPHGLWRHSETKNNR